MSERVSIDPKTGDAFIDDDFERGNYALVPASDRAAIALALLGGITDEMIERCGRAIWSDGEWPKLDAYEQENARQDARHVLEAVFGAALGGGGEGDQ